MMTELARLMGRSQQSLSAASRGDAISQAMLFPWVAARLDKTELDMIT